MKLQWIVIAVVLATVPAAFSQQTATTDDPVPAVEAQLQLKSERELALSNEERDIIRGLEEIENDPVVRAKAAAEAKVPLSVF